MLRTEDQIFLLDNFHALLAQFKHLEKRLEIDLNLKNQYASDIHGDFEKSFLVPISPHDSKNCSDRDWYLTHRPDLNPNLPSKYLLVLKGA